jgi:hypothetical protein
VKTAIFLKTIFFLAFLLFLILKKYFPPPLPGMAVPLLPTGPMPLIGVVMRYPDPLTMLLSVLVPPSIYLLVLPLIH